MNKTRLQNLNHKDRLLGLHRLGHSVIVLQQKPAGAQILANAQHKDVSNSVREQFCLRGREPCNFLWRGLVDQKGLIHKHLDIFSCQHPHDYIGTVCVWKDLSHTPMRVNKTELDSNFAPKVRLLSGFW